MSGSSAEGRPGPTRQVGFGDPSSLGGRATLGACSRPGRPSLIVVEGVTLPSHVAAWIEAKGVRVLNVAGNRESTSPGIGAEVERFLRAVFRRFGPLTSRGFRACAGPLRPVCGQGLGCVWMDDIHAHRDQGQP